MPAAVRYIVDDVDRAVDFYCGLLGFDVDSQPGPGFAALRREDLRLYLSRPGDGGAGRTVGGDAPVPGGGARMQITVPDLATAIDTLRMEGVRFRGDAVIGKDGRQILLDDPSGNCVELFEPASREDDPFAAVAERGLVLLGCGKMGSALLEGWLAGGLPAGAIAVVEPAPSPRLLAHANEGLRLNTGLPANPAIVVAAVKPQMMADALPSVSALGHGGTLFVSIAAGTSLATLADALGSEAPIVRAMPNTPAAIGRGVTALVGNARASSAHLDQAEALLRAVGRTVRLEDEAQMDAVTAVSGSGPAYVFLLIEAMAAAGAAEGLPEELALELARATVDGASALAMADDGTHPSSLRKNVTSPGGTTAAALEVLMREGDGLTDLVREAVAAAAARSRELAGG